MRFLILVFFFDKNSYIIYKSNLSKVFQIIFLFLLDNINEILTIVLSVIFTLILQLQFLLRSRTKHIFICRCELRLPSLMLYVVFETTNRCLSVYRFARNKTSVSNHPLVFLCLPTKMSDQKKKKTLNF